MKKLSLSKRGITLLVILLPVLAAFVYVVTSSGPLAPIPVTMVQVESRAISPALFGVGLVEARFSYRIGPAMTGHVLRLDSHVGDKVVAGQVVGEMDPVDMDNKIAAKDAAIKRAQAAINAADANVADFVARERYAKSQSLRYTKLAKAKTISDEVAEAKSQEHHIASAGLVAIKANLNAAREELEMLRADYDGLVQQKSNLNLTVPVDGLVVGRYVEPGSTVIAGQTVIEVIDPLSLWINVRFDQLQSSGLAVGLPASIVLRSRPSKPLDGRITRVEPLADSVTEEILAKVVFDQLPDMLPPVGELAKVTVTLPALAATPVVPNASIKRVNGVTGVWLIENSELRYAPVDVGVSDLDGRVQITHGLKAGDHIVVYSKQELSRHSRITIVDQIVNQPVDAAP
jgi:RND family efflux transporter MFP subunit